MQPHITTSLRSTATTFLHQAITIVFTSPSVYADASATPLSSSPRFGLPCAVKVLGFLCQKLHQRSVVSSGAASTTAPSAPSRREIQLSFSLLVRVLIACDAEQLTQVPSLMLFIKDDLCSALLRYGRLGYALQTH